MQIIKPDRDPHKYACGIFIVKNFDPKDFISYVKTYQPVIPFEKGVELIKKRLEKVPDGKQDMEVEVSSCPEIKIDLKCNLTLKRISIPIKG